MRGLRPLPGLCTFALAVGLTASSGCGNPHGTVPVSGKVTVKGESPPGAGTISFTCVEAASGFPQRPAMAKFDTDGAYQVTSFSPGDGLIPGKYKLAIECYETPPNMDGKPVKSYIDAKYMNGETSGFELDVEPKARPIQFNINLQ